jgi:hypothetical protein
MLAFNPMSSLCSDAMRELPLKTIGMLLMGSLALDNVGDGARAAWRWVREPTLDSVKDASSGA